ncbi:hypothetical protein [Marinobacter caseinilyticus]|uniref:hypothetical protein n=1 Tax=Marinobacter caseinilyticus TaxID=2692195 RepID=UPI00140BD1F9|nr:hypothetical protein [Marinobacter caseinilyticus]
MKNLLMTGVAITLLSLSGGVLAESKAFDKITAQYERNAGRDHAAGHEGKGRLQQARHGYNDNRGGHQGKGHHGKWRHGNKHKGGYKHGKHAARHGHGHRHGHSDWRTRYDKPRYRDHDRDRRDLYFGVILGPRGGVEYRQTW